MVAWENLRALIKRNVPTSVMMPLIRIILKLPPKTARFLVADFTSPTKAQQEWIQLIECPTWKGAWIGRGIKNCNNLHKRIKEADLIIYKAHGGAFRVGHCAMYMDVFIYWMDFLKAKYNINALILSVEYSLAPEFTYPTPVLECVAAYRYLTCELKVPGSKIILSGDSAGGALCLETLVRVYSPEILIDSTAFRSNYSIEIPAGLFLVSPLVSADISSWLWHYSEDMITPVLANCVLKEYLNLPKVDPSDLHILKLSKIRSGFDRFLPKSILVYVGQREVMRDDILSLVDTIRRDGTSNIQVRKEDYGHEWYFIREIVKARDKHILHQSDQQFVDFAVNSIRNSLPKPNLSSETFKSDNLAKTNVAYAMPKHMKTDKQVESGLAAAVSPVKA